VQLQILEVRGPQDLSDVIDTAKKQGAGAVMVLGSPTLFEYQRRLAELVTKAHLPTISAWRQLSESGGLVSYGADIPEMFRRAAVYVDKILKGTKPADLPVEQPSKSERVVNPKTAKALGLTISQSILIRADAVIQ
jgi:putative ABC transport system substrate-binding protein